MASSTIKRRVFATVGRVAAYVPLEDAKLFAFVASPAVRTKPWPFYAHLHDHRPVRPSPYPGIWMVASHAGVDQVLRSSTVSVDEALATAVPQAELTSPFAELLGRSLLFVDAPDHTRLRRLVARAFTPRTVEALRPRVVTRVDETLGRLAAVGEADLIGELALPLPVSVICELLGVPEAESGRFLTWARHLAPRLDLDLFRDEERDRLGDQAAIELGAYFDELIRDPTRRDPDGLLAQLVAVEEDGDRLSHDEVISLGALLLAAGFETTTNLIGNGLLALIQHPDQLARVRDGDVDPASALNELLRFAGPVQFTQRVPLEPIDVGGCEIPAYTQIALLLGAANRDPHVFTEPDRLDVGRDPNPHLSFSLGIHHCLGAALARLEAEIAIPAVVRALPELRLVGRPRWRDTFVIRALTALPVTWRV